MELIDVLTLDKMSIMMIGAVLLVLGLLLFIPIIPSLRKKVGEGGAKKVQIGAAVVVMLAIP